jgi:hypothetical protein
MQLIMSGDDTVHNLKAEEDSLVARHDRIPVARNRSCQHRLLALLAFLYQCHSTVKYTEHVASLTTLSPCQLPLII